MDGLNEAGKIPAPTDVVVFHWDTPGPCCACHVVCNYLAGPDYYPQAPGFAHYVCGAARCRTSFDRNSMPVIQNVTGPWPFKGTGIKLRVPCFACSTLTTNKKYCSVDCRMRAMYPDWDTRRAEVVTRRDAGASFAEIGAALGFSAARASAVYHHQQKGANDSIGPEETTTVSGPGTDPGAGAPEDA